TSRAFLNSADVHFVNDEITIPAQKSILSDVSPVFKQMFFGPLKEEGDIKLCFSPTAFQEFLQLFYLPKMTFSMENCKEVAQIIDYYDMAIFLDHQELKEMYTKRFIFIPMEILRADEFPHSHKVLLEVIVSMKFLLCDEIDLLHRCLYWAKRSCRKKGIDEPNGENLRAELGDDIFKMIRFRAMSSSNIQEINDRYKSFLTNEEIKAITAKESHGSISVNDKQRSTPPFHSDKSCCWKETNYKELFYSVGNVVPTWFTSNHFLSLGKIQFEQIFGAIVTIVEYAEQSFESDVKQKILYEGRLPFSSKTPDLTLDLSHQPILIHSKKMSPNVARCLITQMIFNIL
ncbi:hypothetical protein Bhyg_05699, partial [Pseudolycoriella hygida]